MSDLKFALRQLLNNPGFTAVAVLTLALGIGATTAMFSVVDAVLIKPLPYPRPDRLVAVCESNPKLGWDHYVTSMGAYSDWRDQTTSFEQLAGAIVLGPSPIVGEAGAEMVHVAAVSANFFPLLGIQTIVGRSFHAGEESPDRGDVVLLSEYLWRNRFGADPNILNQTVRLGDRQFTVVGVMPASLRLFDPAGVQGWNTGFSECDLWRPLPVNSGLKKQRNYRAFLVLGRLKPGVSVQQAQGELTVLAREQAAQFPESNAGWGISVQPWSRVISQSARMPLLLLLGAVVVVLSIMTVNLANLYLARVARREREMAVRMALGAGRLRLIRQLLVESLTIACAGGAAGWIVAGWSLRVLARLIPASIPRVGEIHLNAGVLGVTLATSLVVGVFFGLIPALTFLRSNRANENRLNGRAMTAGRHRHRSRSVLIAAQVALVVVLVSGAGLLIRSFRRLSEVNPGFVPNKLIALDTTINGMGYTNESARIQAVGSLLDRLRARPDLQAIAAVDGLPLDPGRGNMDIALTSIEGTPPTAPDEKRIAGLRLVSAGYFDVMRIPLLRGRDFTERDTANSAPVVILNEAFVRRHFGGVDPIGKRIASPDFGAQPCEVVGIVGNVRHQSLNVAPQPEAFRPLLQECFSSVSIVARTGDGTHAENAIREQINTVDEQWPVYRSRRLEDLVNDSMAPRRFALLLLELFAGLALLMAFVGIQGVLACVVGERRREIAIRFAVGAQRRAVIQMVLGHAFRAVAIGMLIGLAGVFAAGNLLRGQLFGIASTDPGTLSGVVLMLAGVSLLACWIPLQRAVAVQPFEALRNE